MIDQYKIVELKMKDFDIKNRFYVFAICSVNKNNRCKYRLVKQCSSKKVAQEYIKSHTIV